MIDSSHLPVDSEQVERALRARLAHPRSEPSRPPVRPAQGDAQASDVALHLSESAAHKALKGLAAEWAVARRLSLYAAEVRLPRSGYRADLAACTPRTTSAGAFTAVFECKVSRADFLRDAAPEAETAAELADLTLRLGELRALIAEHRPDLRRGEELFPAFDCWDLRGLRHATHDQLSRRLRVAQRKLHEGTKFSKMARWRSASLLYAVCEPGVMEPWELPEGWGWLERAGDALILRAKPCLHPTTTAERIALLERIAAATASGEGRRLGVRRPSVEAAPPPLASPEAARRRL